MSINNDLLQMKLIENSQLCGLWWDAADNCPSFWPEKSTLDKRSEAQFGTHYSNDVSSEFRACKNVHIGGTCEISVKLQESVLRLKEFLYKR